jgi:hypothetical protein
VRKGKTYREFKGAIRMAKKSKVTLIASTEKNPPVNVKPGQQLNVTAVVIQGPEAAKIKKVGARGLVEAVPPVLRCWKLAMTLSIRHLELAVRRL